MSREYEYFNFLMSNLKEIAIGNHKAISTLENILKNEKLDDYTKCSIAETLEIIDVGNIQAISIFVEILLNSRSSIELKLNAFRALDQIDLGAFGQLEIITTLVKLSQSPNSYSELFSELLTFFSEAVYRLKVIEINKSDIYPIIDFMQNLLITTEPEIDLHICYMAAEILGVIDPTNEVPIINLTQILLKGTSSYLEKELSHVAWILEKVLMKRDISLWKPVVSSLLNGVSNEIYENDYIKFKECYRVLWYCAQNMSYPDFYNAYNIPKKILESERIFIDCYAIQKELDRTTKHPEICCLVVDVSHLENLTDQNLLSKRIWNGLQKQLPDFELPKVNDIGDLEYELDKLQKELGKKLAIALYGKNANEAIHQLCQSLTESIPIRPFIEEKSTQELIDRINTWLSEM